MTSIQNIKYIGKKGVCSEEQMMSFLPDSPLIQGNEFIFGIGWANAKKYIDEEIEYFVKGLHIIEEKYKSKFGNDFGFGSPSPTYKLIEALAKIEYEKAIELELWIALNSGNYYISKVSSPELFKSRLNH